MAAAERGGFDVVFVDILSERLTCPVCHMAIREPRLTECGHQFCSICLTRAHRPEQSNATSCPVCRTELKSSMIYPNNALKREILDLKIKCDQHKEGCEWVGELRNRKKHCDECQYVGETCANKCGKMLMRKHMDGHVKNWCLRRPMCCEYCESTITWSELEDHYRKCDKYLMSCTNCGEMMRRCLIEVHVGRQGTCPNSLLDCDFKNNGCPFRGTRSELLKHIECNMAGHFSFMAMELTGTKRKLECTEDELISTRQKLAKTEDKLADVELQLCHQELNTRSLSLPSCRPKQFIHTWRIENWSEKTVAIRSEAFYVYPGYHLYLSAFPDEVDDDDPYLGVYLHATTGDFDEIINWPFAFSYDLEVVDQQPDGNNIIVTISLPYEDSLTSPTCKTGCGEGYLASHKTLQSRCYIKDDAITIRLTIHLDEQ